MEIDQGANSKQAAVTHLVQERVEKKVTITEFVTQNDKLLAALAVFSALALFAMSTPLKAIGAFLFIMYFGATVLVWLELWKNFPDKPTTSLDVMGWLLLLASVGMVLQLVLEVNHYYPPFIALFLFVGFAALPVWVMNKTQVRPRLSGNYSGKPTRPRQILASLLCDAVIFGCVFAGFAATPRVSKYLDEGYQYLKRQDITKMPVPSNTRATPERSKYRKTEAPSAKKKV